MDIRFCHPSDFSSFLCLNDPKTVEFKGVFGHLFNTLSKSFLVKFNFSAIVYRGGGYGEQIDSNGTYDGCLGQLQSNRSDVMLRFAEFPLQAGNISQGDVFLDTRVVFGQLYFHDGEDKKFQILSTVKSLNEVTPYILLYFISVFSVLKMARILSNCRHYRVYYTYGPLRVVTKRVTNHNITNALAHAFRFGYLRARRLHSRLIFLSLSIFSLILISRFNSSIKTDLVVVNEPDHWKTYDDIVRDNVKPIFIHEMETIQYFKNARAGSSEYELWHHAIKKFQLDETFVSASVQSFFTAGVELHSRSSVLVLDDVMGPVIQNAGCSLNAYNHTGFAMTQSDKSYDFEKTFYLYLTSDTSAQIFQKGLVFNQLFSSYPAVKFRWFAKSLLEMGIAARILSQVKSQNIIDDVVHNLPPSGKDRSVVTDCKSPSVIKAGSMRDKIVTFGNIITLLISYLTFNGMAWIISIVETIYAASMENRKNVRPQPWK